MGGPNFVARFDDAGNVTQAWPVPGALIVATSQGAVWATDAFAGTVTRIRGPSARPSEGDDAAHPALTNDRPRAARSTGRWGLGIVFGASA